MNHTVAIRVSLAAILLAALGLRSASVESEAVFFAGTPATVAQVPLYIKEAVPPLNMLVMGKDHKIYYEAYNDAGDLNGDGILDVGYKPTKIDYYGYFNSYVCYVWDGTKFAPSSATSNKRCAGKWSGDFLNYVTTSRMDALRRVLYGGWRHVDTDTETVLQGAFFPQDGHSWGKEYQGASRDGYDIRDYAPVAVPDSGKYVLFAVTTLTGNGNAYPNYQAPTLRVLENSPYRIWNWLSIEGPVGGNKCFTASSARVDCVSGGTVQPFPGHPASRAEFDTLVTNYAKSEYRFGSGAVSAINCNGTACNPYGADDNYLSVFEGQIVIPAGRYQFRVDGDDVIDLQLRQSNGAVLAQAGCYTASGRGFGPCGNQEKTAVVNYNSNTYFFTFRQEDAAGGDGYRLQYRSCNGNGEPSCAADWSDVFEYNGTAGIRNATLTTYNLSPSIGGATRNDYYVRVQTCPNNASLRDSSCKPYGSHFKPTGILHEYGETQKMYFGLITGTQSNNLEGGVLRKNISNFANEINTSTGVFKSNVDGIVNAIDRLRMIGGGYAGNVSDNSASDANWNWANGTGNCPSVGSRSIINGECRMWGNPIAEMLYESMRYFAGADPTPRFATGGASEGATEETTLGLKQEAWKDPYKSAGDDGLGFPTCAAPVQTIISDINPSYDGDIPGSAFAGAATSTGTTPAKISGFNAAAEGQDIWNAEYPIGGQSVFIGEVAGATDGAPTAKNASSFGNIRGLSPEEPTKGGTYYSASVARFGFLNDVNDAIGPQKITTYAIALASPLPKIELPNGISILPFAKTASGTFGDGGQANKPTNTIVDFYVQQYENFPGQVATATNGGRPYALFRINYEDVEQGNDHDMDAIVIYEIKGNANGTVSVNLTSEYAAGSADQNIGYVISGSNKNGIYLAVRDTDSPAASFKRYDLNTPPGIDPNGCKGVNTGACIEQLPLTSVRTFTATGTNSAIKLQDPLWYAAKYGSAPTASAKPENYFLVTNPLTLREQLSKAFDRIADTDLDVGSASISGARVGNASFTLQPGYSVGRNSKNWVGQLSAISVERDGSLGRPLWSAATELGTRAPGSRNIRAIVDARPGTFSAKEFASSTTGISYATIGAPTTPALRTEIYGADYILADLIGYLRGDRSKESGTGGTLRARTSVLGDIVNSEPVIASPKSNYGYANYSDAMFDRYGGAGGYLTTKAIRKTVTYIGANDGMLHAFDASTKPCSTDPASPDFGKTCAAIDAGRELFAFIPNAVLPKLGELPKIDSKFSHRYLVDGQIAVGDAKDGNTWKTLLVGSTGGGGRSVYALDVSDPTAFGDDRVLWERNSVSDLDVGNVYGKPLLVPLENGDWGVLFGNGYGGNRSDPSLYVLNAFSGALIAKLTADDGNLAKERTLLGSLLGLICGILPIGGEMCVKESDPYNGLGQITSIDKDGDGKVDTVYGGDLQGHLWKFDLSAGDKNDWKVANGGKALFRTQSTKNESNQDQYQPITGGIRIASGPGNGVMVYFGTGRYFVTGDNDVSSTPQVQSLYAFFDDFLETSTTRVRSDLTEQTVSVNNEQADPAIETRKISTNPVFYYGAGAKRGWYMDLKLTGATSGSGERFIATPLIQSGRVFFTTYTPLKNSCDPDGANIQYGLDLLTGTGALGNVKLQTTGQVACKDGACGAAVISNTKEGATTQAPVTSTGVAAITPTLFIDPACQANPTAPGCAGGPTFEECQVVIYPGAFVLPRPCGRQSWRQLK